MQYFLKEGKNKICLEIEKTCNFIYKYLKKSHDHCKEVPDFKWYQSDSDTYTLTEAT